MKIIVKIPSINGILSNIDFLIWNPLGIQRVNSQTRLESIIESSIYYATILNNKLYYQKGDDYNNLYIYKGKHLQMGTYWNLWSAFSVEQYIYVYCRGESISPQYHLLDENLNIVGIPPQDCSFYHNKYLFRNAGDDLICYPIDNLTPAWQINTGQFYEDKPVIKHLFGFESIIILALENNALIALNLSDGSLEWKCEEKIGPHFELFDGVIYTVGGKYEAYNITTIDARTGKILKKENVQPVFKQVGFYPDCDIIAYNDLLFLKSVRDGVLIFNRENLSFKEHIHFENLIPTGKDNLIWHNSRLYVLDTEKVLHILE